MEVCILVQELLSAPRSALLIIPSALKEPSERSNGYLRPPVKYWLTAYHKNSLFFWRTFLAWITSCSEAFFGRPEVAFGPYRILQRRPEVPDSSLD